MKIKPLALIPVIVFAVLAGLMAGGNFRDDPQALPSTREGQPAPGLTLGSLGEKPGFGAEALSAPGVKLVNFWASWCAPCRVEHPHLQALADEGIAIYGINYEDDPAKAPPGCYERLADALAGSAADVISLEDAHRRNDLDLLTRFGTKSVMLGVVDIGRTHLESVDALKERIAAAVDTIGADRLIVGSDCGMTLLPETVAWAKIEAMVAAVRAL